MLLKLLLLLLLMLLMLLILLMLLRWQRLHLKQHREMALLPLGCQQLDGKGRRLLDLLY